MLAFNHRSAHHPDFIRNRLKSRFNISCVFEIDNASAELKRNSCVVGVKWQP